MTAPGQSPAPAEADDAQAPPADVVVRRGRPSTAESAAVLAVVAAALDEHTSDGVTARPSAPEAWRRSARGLRAPLPRGGWLGGHGPR